MQATMQIKAAKLKQFQELVKHYDFRFVWNPYVYNDMANVCINGDHLPMEKCNQFFETWYRLNSEIREVPQRPKWKRTFDKIKKIFH